MQYFKENICLFLGFGSVLHQNYSIVSTLIVWENYFTFLYLWGKVNLSMVVWTAPRFTLPSLSSSCRSSLTECNIVLLWRVGRVKWMGEGEGGGWYDCVSPDNKQNRHLSLKIQMICIRRRTNVHSER